MQIKHLIDYINIYLQINLTKKLLKAYDELYCNNQIEGRLLD